MSEDDAAWSWARRSRPFRRDGDAHVRIPSVVCDPGGRLFAFANRRWGTFEDSAAVVDLQVRTSDDGGRTWSAPRAPFARAGWCASMGAAVVDDASGDVLLFYSRGPVDADARADEARDPIGDGHYLARSRDRGHTWEHAPVALSPNRAGFGAGTHGCGSGITLRAAAHSGRLVVPARYLAEPGADGEDPAVLARAAFNCALLSDDGGATWRTSEPVQPGTGEGCLVETGDGEIYLNSRAYFDDGLRRIAWSRDGGASFGELAVAHDLREPMWGAAADVTRVPCVSGRDGFAYVLCHLDHFVPPAAREGRRVRHRRRLTARVSLDGCRSWPYRRVLREGPAAYASVTATPAGEVVCLFEGGEEMPYEWLEAAVFTVAEVLEPGAGATPDGVAAAS